MFSVTFFQAITNPRNESYQTRAWEAVLPLVSKLKRFYEFSQQIGKDVLPVNLFDIKSFSLLVHLFIAI